MHFYSFPSYLSPFCKFDPRRCRSPRTGRGYLGPGGKFFGTRVTLYQYTSQRPDSTVSQNNMLECTSNVCLSGNITGGRDSILFSRLKTVVSGGLYFYGNLVGGCLFVILKEKTNFSGHTISPVKVLFVLALADHALYETRTYVGVSCLVIV